MAGLAGSSLEREMELGFNSRFGRSFLVTSVKSLLQLMPLFEKKQDKIRMPFINHLEIYRWRGLVRVRYYYHTPHPLLSVHSSSSLSSQCLPALQTSRYQKTSLAATQLLVPGPDAGSASPELGSSLCGGSCPLRLVPSLRAALPLHLQQLAQVRQT